MFCSGVDEATLKAVLEAKFKQCDSGWYNERLQQEIEKRKEYTDSQSLNGTIGQFWKKVKTEIKSEKEYAKIRKKFFHVSKQELFNLINLFNNQENTTAKAVLEATLQHLENENRNENEIVIDKKRGIDKGEKYAQFENFRLAYPGNKRGYEIELKTLQKHDDWQSVIPLLTPALQKEMNWRSQAKAANVWTPDWANLQTWLNQRRWEQELKSIESPTQQLVYTPLVKQELSTEQQIKRMFGEDADPKDYFFNAKKNTYEKLPLN